MGAYRIAIAGCGPGGLAAALFLKRAGHEVTLFERFEEAQPVGSGLLIQPTGQAVLDRLGLLDNIHALAAPVARLHGISTTNGHRALDMSYANTKAGTPALGLHRASLFSVLMDAVRAEGIGIQTSSELVEVIEDDAGVFPIFAQSETGGAFDLLIDACGARSPLGRGKAHQLPFGAFWTTVDIPKQHDVLPGALDQRYQHARQMAGIMPIGFNPATGNQGAAVFWSVKPERAQELVDQGIESFRKRFCALWPEAEPFVAQIRSFEDLTLATYHHRTGPSALSGRIIHVGDSWHSTSPQLGQGANMALIDAAALSDAIDRAEGVQEITGIYAGRRDFHISLYQSLSWIFTPVYQSEGRVRPLLRDTLIHYFARWPLVRRFIAVTVSGQLGYRY